MMTKVKDCHDVMTHVIVERFEQLKKDFEPLTNWLKNRYTAVCIYVVITLTHV